MNRENDIPRQWKIVFNKISDLGKPKTMVKTKNGSNLKFIPTAIFLLTCRQIARHPPPHPSLLP